MPSQHYCAGAAAATCLAFLFLIIMIQKTSAQHLTVVPNVGMGFRASNISTSIEIPASRRRRRYVRFPALSGSEIQSGAGRLVYPHSPRPPPPPNLHPGHSSWIPTRHKQPYHQVTAPAVGGHYTRVPQMGQRSPRLVFRDPDIPGTIHASSPYYSQQAANSLHDLVTDDSREGRVPGQEGYPLLGDQSLCATGTCEFFLSCWMSAGLLEGSCGGFLYACCQRRVAKDTAKKGEHDENSLLLDYGPVTNDPSK